MSALQTEIDLIDQVRVRQFLYEKKSSLYKDKNMQMNGWRSVAEDLGHDITANPDVPQKLQQQWIKIRNEYTEYLKKISKIPTGSGAKSFNVPTFRFSAEMEFYKPYYTPYAKKSVSNFGTQQLNPLSPPSSVSSRASNNDDDDDDDLSSNCSIFNQSEIQDYLDVNDSIEKAVPIESEGAKRKKSKKDYDKEFLDLYKSNLGKEDEYYHFAEIVAERLWELEKKKGKEAVIDCELAIMAMIRDAAKEKTND